MESRDVKKEVLSWARYMPKGWEIRDAEKGVLIGIMNNALRFDKGIFEANHRRHEVLAWLFRELLNKPSVSLVSTKELTNEMWWCLYKYIEPHKDTDTGAWVGNDNVNEALYVCWREMEYWMADLNAQLGFTEKL